mgnify:CR=1 FL=1
MPTTQKTDVLILGSGAAGLTLALRLAAADISVTVVSKGKLTDGSTFYAQGGISAVLDETDSIESHVADTLDAGAGLCREDVVRYTVERGPACIEWLVKMGVPFTRTEDDSGFHLTREGGHSHRRVIHAADATGHAVQTTLESLARAHPLVHVLEYHIAVDLITAEKLGQTPQRCHGAYVLDIRRGVVTAVSAPAVVVATGGANMAYLYSSNPFGASGDGIAMAWRAGCRVANMEFMQFHPTCLYHPQSRSFLVSEAVRGEGGKLLLPDGTPFMAQFDDRAELAPRDIVARAIDHEMKRLGVDHVLLDISHKPAEFIEEHFPTILRQCLALGYDMRTEPLPVVPAAHYTCGGIMTDLSGHTDIHGLYAIGEAACTGLHGANRMASNSLLECLVFASAAAEDIAANIDFGNRPTLPDWDESKVTDSDEEVVVSHNWQEVRRFMWDYVGIVRTDKRLARAQHRIDMLKAEIDEYYGNFRISSDLLELRNLVQIAELIVQSAMSRKESRGLHYNLDYPGTLPHTADTVLKPPGRST